MPIELSRVGIATPRGSLDRLLDFYSGLGFEVADHGHPALALHIGYSTLQFTEVTGDERPFYHFAFLVPGNRFDAAYAWLSARTTLLSRPASDLTVFDFEFWNARACYFHDPVGNIAELIAHRDLATDPERTGPFHPTDLVSISEIALVTPDRAGVAATLESRLGLPLWSGDVSQADGLGFVGRQARTLILAPPGRGWLPTGGPAEVHPVEVRLTGPIDGEVAIAPHRVTAST